MTIEPSLYNKLKITSLQAVAMATTTNPFWYLQSCEFNKIKPIWSKAPYIGLGGNLFSFTGCMTAYTVTYHSYKRLMERFGIQESEYQDFFASYLSGLSAAGLSIGGESKSVQSYAASEHSVVFNNKPLTPINRTLARRAMFAGWKSILARDSINYSLIFYGGPRFDHFAQSVIPEIGKTGGALFACGCSSILTVLLTNTFQNTRMNQQSNAWLRAAGRDDLATKLDTWWSVLCNSYKTGGLRSVAFKGSRCRLAAIGVMQLWERVIHN